MRAYNHVISLGNFNLKTNWFLEASQVSGSDFHAHVIIADLHPLYNNCIHLDNIHNPGSITLHLFILHLDLLPILQEFKQAVTEEEIVLANDEDYWPFSGSSNNHPVHNIAIWSPYE